MGAGDWNRARVLLDKAERALRTAQECTVDLMDMDPIPANLRRFNQAYDGIERVRRELAGVRPRQS